MTIQRPGRGEQIIKRTTTTRKYHGRGGHSHNHSQGSGKSQSSGRSQNGGGKDGSPTIIIVNAGGGGASTIDGGSLEDLLLADGFPGSRGFDYGNSRFLDQPSFLGGGYLDRDRGYGRGRGGRGGGRYLDDAYYRGGRGGYGRGGGLTGNRSLNLLSGATIGGQTAGQFGGSALAGTAGGALGQLLGDTAAEGALIGGLTAGGVDMLTQFNKDDIDLLGGIGDIGTGIGNALGFGDDPELTEAAYQSALDDLAADPGNIDLENAAAQAGERFDDSNIGFLDSVSDFGGNLWDSFTGLDFVDTGASALAGALGGGV